MRAAVLSVGSELLRGDIVDTNAPFLASQLSRMGFEIDRIQAVGDDLDRLADVVADAIGRADVVICTGGLGPTEDDLTREAIARTVDEEIYLDEKLLAELEARFQAMNRRMPPRNRQQASLIPSAESIPNPHGTAPGWLVRHDQAIIVAMPGPPGEMIPMWEDEIRPRLEELQHDATATRSLLTFGLGESAVEEKIRDLIHWRPEVTVATYAKSAGVEVHVTARAAEPAEAQQLADQAERMARRRLGRDVVGSGGENLASAVGKLLKERGMTLAVMESCTGGALSDLITDVDGSSDTFLGGSIAYSVPAKVANGVDQTTIEHNGIYSAETAKAMAEAIRRQYGASAGLGITGIAGTESLENKPPGTCFIAAGVQFPDGASERVEVREIRRPGQRSTVKHFAALCALDLLRRMLLTDEEEA